MTEIGCGKTMAVSHLLIHLTTRLLQLGCYSRPEVVTNQWPHFDKKKGTYFSEAVEYSDSKRLVLLDELSRGQIAGIF